ncbi:hypothetical protein [Rummeliibacillus suwonensis]|uniref:hypothetical protein n=1 Tax=Rummeliibacillus suwonensis TaxID=1306154 RepID=UPI002899A375|nr:hypothetical protein [Rummeliibacillus suwonensis]
METEEYIGAHRDIDIEMKEQDGINLMDQVITNNNLWGAYKKVKQNNGAPGVDGITVTHLKSHMKKYYKPLKEKLKDGSYQPQPVKRVAIPKTDGTKRYLEINIRSWKGVKVDMVATTVLIVFTAGLVLLIRFLFKKYASSGKH